MLVRLPSLIKSKDIIVKLCGAAIVRRAIRSLILWRWWDCKYWAVKEATAPWRRKGGNRKLFHRKMNRKMFIIKGVTMNHSIIQDQSDINFPMLRFILSLVRYRNLSNRVPLWYKLSDIIISVLTGSTWIFYAAIAVEFILVLVASGTARSNSPAQGLRFLAYSAIYGFTLSIIMLYFSQLFS